MFSFSGSFFSCLKLKFLFYLLADNYRGYINHFMALYMCYSEITAEGRRITKLDQILLNGNNIAIVSEIWWVFFIHYT